MLANIRFLSGVDFLLLSKGDFTGMLCAPSLTIISTNLSRDLIIPAYASGERSESDGDC